MSEVVLNDICELIVDCPHSTAYDEGAGYPLVRTPNIGRGRLIYSGMHRVCEEVYNRRNARAIPQTNDLIFAREATAGNVALLIQESEKVCLGQRTVLIRPNASLVNPAFLTYYLLAPEQQYKLLSTANGATVAHVNMPTIRNLKLSLPDLPTQHRIATILSRYDSLIENYQKQIKLLEEAAQRLYKEWFIDLRFPGHENTNIIDGVPEGWEKKSVDSIYNIKYGKNLSTKLITETGLYPVYGANGVIGYYDKANCNEQVVLITSRGNGSGDVLMTYHKDAFITNNSFIVTPSEGFEYCKLPFTFQFLKMANFRAVRTGAAQPQLTNQSIHTVDVVLPEKKLIEKFCASTNGMNDAIIKYRKQLRLLTEARDRLLPKLMSGEIDVQ
ncbi:MAG: restriction endonuclease subunit S [Bacteroidaceae bacterium]|nr:restriction endonuclease subunit S [Bacteroidaceae bacterium]